MEPESNIDRASIIMKAISTVLSLGVNEINTVAEDSTFVNLGGNSLSAILVAAKCHQKGFSFPVKVLLRESSLKRAIMEANVSAQRFPIHSTASSTPAVTALLLTSQLLERVMITPLSPVGTGADESSLLPLTQDTLVSCTSAGSPRRQPYCNEEKIIQLKSISATDLLGRINPIEWTETQLLLLRDTSKDRKRNMLTIHKTYTGEWDAQLVCSIWTNTILAEPVFKDVLADFDIPLSKLMAQAKFDVNTENRFQGELCKAAITVGHLSHLTVVKLASTSVAVVWHVHHAFMDGFSARILLDKVSRNMLGGDFQVSPGPSFKITVREMRKLREERREATRLFWDGIRARFTSAVGELSLNPQRAREESTSQRYIAILLPESEMASAQARTGHTPIVYLAAAWALPLGMFMDADQVFFGLAFSGRDLPISGALAVVGPLINILPLFVQLPSESDHETSIWGFLQSIQKAICELNDVRHSDTTDGFDRRFTSIIATQFNEIEGTEGPGLLDPRRSDLQSGIPLNLIVHGRSSLEVFYSSAHYSEEDMNNVSSVFQLSLNYLLQDDDKRLLTPTVRQRLLPEEMERTIRQWSNCNSFESLDESKGDDLVTLFESVVARQPTAIAVTCGRGRDTSYDDFDQESAAIARELSWVEPNEPVCVYADRSVGWLTAIFGILKAGGVYVPLDPSAPAPLRQANFIRSGSRAVLFPSSAFVSIETTPVGGLPIAVDDLVAKNKIESQQKSASYPRRRIARPDDLAYICFTSGSTGEPKAVQCTHKSLVAFQKDYLVRLGSKKGTVVAQIMSPVFDGSIHEIFSVFTYGATLRLASDEIQDHPFAHLQDCDSAILTPSMANALDSDQYPRLRNVFLVGEAVPQSVSDAWAKNHLVYNMYGPTEATCGATIKQLVSGEPATLGRANSSSRVYILNQNHLLLPPGAVGEIFLAGIQVSNGYINLPSENATRFLSDLILPSTGQKMYKTGDYAYWDSITGEIHIVGRKDRQIKLHGFRIDLNDLEIRIAKVIPDCKSVAVFCRDEYLVAAYQVAPTSRILLGELEVKMLIGNALPPYAIPRRVFALSELPFTAAGKIDYKRLEHSDSSGSVKSQAQHSTMTGTERMIVRAVRDLMKLDWRTLIDRDSDLTVLGGHSIVQLRLASRISSLIRQPFSVNKVIDNPILSHLAATVDEVVGGASKDGRRVEVAPNQEGWVHSSNLGYSRVGATDRDHHVSPIETVWFSKYQENLGTSSFNVSHVSELDDSFDQHTRLISAWETVLSRHAILRSRFRPSITSQEGVEKSFTAEPPKALYVESFELRAAINAEFSLETEHPIRVLISRKHMLVCVSHIICDYTTLDLLFGEFTAAYRREDKLAALQSASQRRYRNTTCPNTDVDRATANFWRSYFSGIDINRLPPYMKEARSSYHGDSRMFQLSKNTMHNLETISRSLHLTMHQMALGIVSLVLQADNPIKQDLILGSPYFGRQDEDVGTVGLFLQPLPIRVPRRSQRGQDLIDAKIKDFLLAVQESARSALGHAIEWTSLIKLLSNPGETNMRPTTIKSPNHPLFDAMVTFHERNATGQESSLADGAIPGIEPLITWAGGAKFGITFEFSTIKSSAVALRVEYDTCVFSGDEVLEMTRRIDAGLEFICQETVSSITLKDLEKRLLYVHKNTDDGDRVKTIDFGARLRSLVV